MSKTKITISISKDYVEELDKIAKSQNTNRSKLIEEAIKVWEKRRIDYALKKGYQEMREEDKKVSEGNLKNVGEILNE